MRLNLRKIKTYELILGVFCILLILFIIANTNKYSSFNTNSTIDNGFLNLKTAENYLFSIEIDDQYTWIVANIDETLMTTCFGTNWEQFFGLPQNPSKFNKMKINIDSMVSDFNQSVANYSIWNWIDKDIAFYPLADQQDSLTYLNNPLNYTIPHNLTNIFPFFLPTPSASYLTQANLDMTYYISIYRDLINFTQITFGISNGSISINSWASYDQRGILLSIDIMLVNFSDPSQPYARMIFDMARTVGGPRPSYISINAGDIYEYGIFTNPDVSPGGIGPGYPPQRIRFEIIYIGGEEPYLKGALVITNCTTMDENGTWTEIFTLAAGSYTTNFYYLDNPAENIPFYMAFPYFVRNDTNWVELTLAMQQHYDSLEWPPGYETNYTFTALSNGYKHNFTFFDGNNIEQSLTYTSNGVLDIMMQKLNGTEYYTWRLNDFDYEFPNTPVGENVEYIDPISGINITFSNVIQCGTTTINISSTGPDPPAGFNISGSYYNITTTAIYSGNITIALLYDEALIIGNETDLRLMHWEESLEEWINITTWIDVDNNIIYGKFTHFSMFAIIEQVDFTAPDTELIILDCFVDEQGIIHVTSNSTFILAAVDDHSGVSHTFYRINGGDWMSFTDVFYLTGPNGNFTIDYYSIDALGNIESLKSTKVIFDEEIGGEFQGFGLLRIDGHRYCGQATMTITEDVIQMECDDHIATWDIVNQCEFGHLEYIYGQGDLGSIRIKIFHGKSSSYMLAFGTGVFFCGKT